MNATLTKGMPIVHTETEKQIVEMLPFLKPSRNGIWSGFGSITPHTALKLIDWNVFNRKMKVSAISKFSRDMIADRWQVNGEPIIISNENTLIDGQNRLHACIEADTPFETMVVYGVAKESFQTIDSGVPRTAADVLKMKGNVSTRRLAAVARLLFTYQETGNVSKQKPISNGEVLGILEQHPQLADAMGEAETLMRKGIPCSAPYAFCYYVFAQKDPDRARELYIGLGTGENLPTGSPISAFRNMVLRGSLSGNPAFGIPKGEVIIGLLFKVWKHLVSGLPCKQLKYVPGSALARVS